MADDRDPVSSSESSRRAFIQRMVAAGFAGPVIGSFSFSELAAASGPRHTFPNQYHPNQEPPPPPPKCDDDNDDDGKDQGDKGDQGNKGNKGKDRRDEHHGHHG
jgi:hypothetical protein